MAVAGAAAVGAAARAAAEARQVLAMLLCAAWQPGRGSPPWSNEVAGRAGGGDVHHCKHDQRSGQLMSKLLLFDL